MPLRRVCVGQHFANQALFINAAILLWTFDFSEPAGAEGVVTADPAGILDSGLVLYVQLCSDFPEL